MALLFRLESLGSATHAQEPEFFCLGRAKRGSNWKLASETKPIGEANSSRLKGTQVDMAYAII